MKAGRSGMAASRPAVTAKAALTGGRAPRLPLASSRVRVIHGVRQSAGAIGAHGDDRLGRIARAYKARVGKGQSECQGRHPLLARNGFTGGAHDRRPRRTWGRPSCSRFASSSRRIREQFLDALRAAMRRGLTRLRAFIGIFHVAPAASSYRNDEGQHCDRL